MRVLLVEDEAQIAAAVATALDGAGYATERIGDGETAWFRGETEDWDAIVLDLGLPRLDGLTVLRRWRAAGIATPVLVLSARGTWMERVDGIDAGADDYLPKPFQIEELLSRLSALVRRAGGHASAVIDIGDLRVDTRRMSVVVAGRPILLSPLEFRLVRYLAHHRGRVVSQGELFEHVYASDREPDSNALEVLVGRLRRKIGAHLIETRRGHGYVIGAAT
jgi:two-component system, OmpR family, response regulator